MNDIINSSWHFRRLDASDAPALHALEKACFTLPWSEEQCRAAFGQTPFAAFGLDSDQGVLAYISVYITADEMEVLNLAVSPELRRRGIGHRLLALALRTAAKMGMQKAVLEVRVGNTPARSLYERHGFAVAGRRPRYYADTGEDALIYARSLTNYDAAAEERKELHMKTLIAANWKMHKTRAEARQTAAAIAAGRPAGNERSLIVFPPFTAIAEVAAAFAAQEGLAVGGQDVYPAEKGAFTGEISPAMLADAGASWVLTGHSERRHVLGESDELVGRKTAFALAAGLHVILCIGETLEEREAGQLEDVLRRQLQTGLADVSPDAAARVAVAYEPVWAIGTGKVAGSAEVLEAHALARRLLVEVLGTVAHDVPLLYGGSVKPDNAASLLALDNVNGLLIGGASLEAESFLRIAGAR